MLCKYLAHKKALQKGRQTKPNQMYIESIYTCPFSLAP